MVEQFLVRQYRLRNPAKSRFEEFSGTTPSGLIRQEGLFSMKLYTSIRVYHDLSDLYTS
ncbi:hypothetical protein [Larkinella soli]|uniref:hypothetical protein n=1 Tax=Larkinella soli TaxID=1770527 RepID=UPI0013E2F706|nr:hypothetical protein [Larkinella soli]